MFDVDGVVAVDDDDDEQVVEDGTFVVAFAAKFVGLDFFAIWSPAADFISLSWAWSFWTIFAYDDVAVVDVAGDGDVIVVVVDDDTVFVADSSLAAAGVADILSLIFACRYFFNCRRLGDLLFRLIHF